MLHIAVEGSIGSGKSCFLTRLKEVFAKNGQPNFNCYTELLEKWQKLTVEKTDYNLLEMQYLNPKVHALTFPIWASTTKFDQLFAATPYKIVERSLDAQREVFVKLLLQNKSITVLQQSVLNHLIDGMLQVPSIKPNIIVYLKTSAAVALKRTKGRARPKEQSLTIDIFEQLQQYYDNWLLSTKDSNTNVIIVEADNIQSVNIEDLYEKIRILQ